MRRAAIGVGLSAFTSMGGGCHVVVRSEVSRPSASERVQHPDRATARRPAVMWTAAGQLRFVEPLECPTEEITQQRTTLEVLTRPNLATFTVGLLTAAAGGVLLTSGLFSSKPSESPYTYAGIAAAGAGLPLAIGPWIGNGSALREAREAAAPRSVRRVVANQPCGERPLVARSAVLAVAGLEIHGAVDANGVFAVSPYQWIDAYTSQSTVASAVTATVDTGGGSRTIEAVLEANVLRAHAAAYLAHADFDAGIEPLKLVPGIVAGTVRARMVATEHGAEVRVVLPVRNDGPGDAWALRGQITAPATPALDGRMIYVGRLPRGAAVTRELTIPIAPAAVTALRSRPVELSIELRDAHGTAPATPVRFRGALVDGAAR